MSQEFSLLQATLEATADGMAVIDAKGHISNANQRLLKMWGLTPESTLGAHHDMLLKAILPWVHGPEAFAKRWQELEKDAEIQSFDLMELSDGRVIERFSTPQKVGPHTVGRVWSFRDITERRRTEVALRETSERFHAVFQAAGMGVALATMEGAVIAANTTLQSMLGFSEKDLLTKKLNDFIQTESPGVDGAFLRTLGAGSQGPYQIECWCHGVDNRSVSTLLTLSFVRTPDEKPLYAVCLIENISDKKRLTEMVRQSEKMSAVGQLAAGVAHEINNPLSVILGFSQSVLARLTPEDPIRSAMVSIEREALRCRNLVQDLLTFSRDRKPGMTRENVSDVITESLVLIEPQGRVKRVRVERNLPAEPAHALIDRGQIQQVIINLCTNAIDAMPNGGTLTVSVKKESNYVTFRVTDTGIGIANEIKERIFDPFFTTKEIGKGTGLGLSLVYEIVKKHGGVIELYSQIDKGTTFTVRLPSPPQQIVNFTS